MNQNWMGKHKEIGACTKSKIVFHIHRLCASKRIIQDTKGEYEKRWKQN